MLLDGLRFYKKNMTKITRPEYCWGKTVKTTFELGSLESYVLQPTRYEAIRQEPFLIKIFE